MLRKSRLYAAGNTAGSTEFAVGCGWLIAAGKTCSERTGQWREQQISVYNATVSWHDVGVHPCNGITMPQYATSSNLPLPLPSWYLDHEPPVAFSVNSCKTRASRGVCRRYEQGSLDLPGLQKWDASQPSNYLELSRTYLDKHSNYMDCTTCTTRATGHWHCHDMQCCRTTLVQNGCVPN